MSKKSRRDLAAVLWRFWHLPMKSLPLYRFAFLVLFLLTPLVVSATDPSVILLWPNGAPGSEGQTAPEKIEAPKPGQDYIKVSSIHHPSITAYLPARERATGAAVIICPGGGHSFLAMDIEGDNVGKWLAAHGIAGFALKYRLARETGSPYKVEVHALQDTQRAIRLVRSRAQEWGIVPSAIGVMGFSAGGQLAALAATSYDAGNADASDVVDRVSSKPDFQALIYPAIPRDMVLSKEATPPAFLACGYDDRQNISEGLPNLYLQMKKAGVQAELHVYANVGHGFGVRENSPDPVNTWPARFAEWLGQSGFVHRQ